MGYFDRHFVPLLTADNHEITSVYRILVDRNGENKAKLSLCCA